MTACLQELVGPKGKVVGVEVHKMLVDHARAALERWHKGILDSGGIVLIQGNALRGAPLMAFLVRSSYCACFSCLEIHDAEEIMRGCAVCKDSCVLVEHTRKPVHA